MKGHGNEHASLLSVNQVQPHTSAIVRLAQLGKRVPAFTISSTRATGMRLPTWRAADAGPDRRVLASGCAALAGVGTFW
jgi:hypothetical protein